MSSSLQSLVAKLRNQFLSGNNGTVAEVVTMEVTTAGMKETIATAVLEEGNTPPMVEKWILGLMVTLVVWILKKTIFFIHQVYLLQKQGNRLDVSLSVASGWGLSLGII